MASSARQRVMTTLFLVAVCILAGCASMPQDQGVNWAVSNDAQKARLNAMGFPQYN